MLLQWISMARVSNIVALKEGRWSRFDFNGDMVDEDLEPSPKKQNFYIRYCEKCNFLLNKSGTCPKCDFDKLGLSQPTEHSNDSANQLSILMSGLSQPTEHSNVRTQAKLRGTHQRAVGSIWLLHLEEKLVLLKEKVCAQAGAGA
eukprot:g62464.t1